MNKTIQLLANICEKYRFEEKLLFVPSYSIGHQIGEHLAQTGKSWINLRVSTVVGYAQEIGAQELSRGGIRLIDSQERFVIIENLYCSDDSLGGKGSYFEEASEIPGILKCLADAVHELRMAGYNHESIDPDVFLIQEKGEELIRLLASYENLLKDNRLIDHAGMISMATEKIKGGEWLQKTPNVMVLSEFPLPILEKRLVQLAGGESLNIIDHKCPLGLDSPVRFFACPKQIEDELPKPKVNIDLLPWLFKLKKAPDPQKDDTVSLFHALGESNEVRETFRRIFKEEAPLDDVEILITGVDPYICLIYEITNSLNVPATFAGGLPITYTRPGKALILYLKWQSEDFRASHLRKLFSGGCLDLDKVRLEGEKPSPGRAATIIRDAGIGWGRERYSGRFKYLEKSYLSKAKERRENGEEEKAEWADQSAKKVAWVDRFTEKIMATVSQTKPEEIVTIGDLCTGAIDFLNNFCRMAGELDVAAKFKIVEVLESLARASSIGNPAKEAAERIAKVISEVTVGHSNPKPGAVHVGHYRSGGYSGRHHTFVLGLDQARFPGVLLQNPVILDKERQRLGSQIALSSTLVEENVYAMAKVLNSLKGKVTLCYSCRDLREDRERFPSSLLLGIYRLITNDRDGDYSALISFLGDPAGFIPKPEITPITDWEWWLTRKDIHYGADSVHSVYRHLLRGDTAETQRDMEVLTEYDGWIPSSAGAMDPLTNDVTLSCSRLENLAKCPFAFFIRHMLGIEPIEELEKDMSRWLDPMQRGELLHEVFYRFMEELKSRGELPELKKHLKFLESIAMAEVERWKVEVPPASEMAFNRELKDIKLTLDIFLRNEEEHCKTSEPCFFELSFGTGAETVSDISAQDPVKINLKPKGSFKLRGRIDRVDRCGTSEYEVWDYKTGSTWGYRDEGYLNRGRHLQHALYAVATEIMLRRKLDKKAKVVRAGYFFPSPKGEGLRIERNQSDREELYEVLGDLFELLGTGVFPTSFDKEPCGICPYDTICGGQELAIGRSKKKMTTDKKMEPIERLKGHA